MYSNQPENAAFGKPFVNFLKSANISPDYYENIKGGKIDFLRKML